MDVNKLAQKWSDAASDHRRYQKELASAEKRLSSAEAEEERSKDALLGWANETKPESITLVRIDKTTVVIRPVTAREATGVQGSSAETIHHYDLSIETPISSTPK